MNDKTKTIEEELLELTGEEAQGKKEKRPDYLKRMVKAAEAVDETLFDTLSKPAQDWANAGIRADDKKKPIEDFPTEDGSEDAGDTTNGKEAPVATTNTTAKPAKTPAAKPAATPAAAKAPKAAAAPKEVKKRGNGKVEAVLGVILKNPTKKATELVEVLKGMDIEVTASTVSTVRSDFIRSTNFLDSKKLLTKNPFA